MSGYSKGLRRAIIAFIAFGVVVLLTLYVRGHINEGVMQVRYKQAYARANASLRQVLTTKSNEYDFELVNNIENFKLFKDTFNISTQCDSSNISECWAIGEPFFMAYPDEHSLSFIDDKGVAWTSACAYKCSGEILIDVNAFEPPNQYGKDRFVFYPVASSVGHSSKKRMSFSVPEDYTFVNEYFCPSGECLYNSLLH